jgi:hypothetical protein
MTKRGGKRDKAGRPKGASNKLSRVAVGRALASGEDLPLDFILRFMRGQPVEQDVKVNGRETVIRKPLPIEVRLKLAEACAPYLHHKLSAVDKLPSAEPEPTSEADGDHELPGFRRPT